LKIKIFNILRLKFLIKKLFFMASSKKKAKKTDTKKSVKKDVKQQKIVSKVVPKIKVATSKVVVGKKKPATKKAIAKTKILPTSKNKKAPEPKSKLLKKLVITKKIVAKIPVKKLVAKSIVKKTDTKKVISKSPVKKIILKTPVKKISKKVLVKKPVVKLATKKVVAKVAIKKVVSKTSVKKLATKVIVKTPVTKHKSKVTMPIVKAVTKKQAPKVAIKKVEVAKIAKNSKAVLNTKKIVQKVVAKPSKPAEKIKTIEPKKVAVPTLNKVVVTQKIPATSKVTPKIKEIKNTIVAPTHNYIKYEMEFPMHASKHSLFNFITDSSAMSAWFADNVSLVNEEYVFSWDGSPQIAKILLWKEPTLVRYHWLHEPEGTYFEFCIVEDELTSDIALVITDFAEDLASVDAARRLWQSQIEDLHHAIGG